MKIIYNKDFFENIEDLLDEFEEQINKIYEHISFPQSQQQIIDYTLEYLNEYQKKSKNKTREFEDTWKHNIEEIPNFINFIIREEQKKYVNLLNKIEPIYKNLLYNISINCSIDDKQKNNLIKSKKSGLVNSLIRMFLISETKKESEIFNLSLKHKKTLDVAENIFFKKSKITDIFNNPDIKRGGNHNIILNKKHELSNNEKKKLTEVLDSYKYAKSLETIIKEQKIIFYNPQGINVISFSSTISELKKELLNSVKSMRKNLELSIKENIDILMTEVSINKLQAHAAKQINELTWGTLDKLKKLKSSDKEEFILSVICGVLLKDLGGIASISLGKTADVAMEAYKLIDNPKDEVLELLSDKNHFDKFLESNKEAIGQILDKFEKPKYTPSNNQKIISIGEIEC